jgi:hypothetical protein
MEGGLATSPGTSFGLILGDELLVVFSSSSGKLRFTISKQGLCRLCDEIRDSECCSVGNK